MSYKTPSKTRVIKLTLNDISDINPQSHKTSNFASTKNKSQTPMDAKFYAVGSPMSMTGFYSTASTAMTKSKPLTPSLNRTRSMKNVAISPSSSIKFAPGPASQRGKGYNARSPSPKPQVVEAKSPVNPVKVVKRRDSYVEELGLTATEVKEKLFKVFQFYTSLGERNNLLYLKNHRFTKMMVDAEVRDEYLNQSSLDLLFFGELKHSGNLDFDKFLSLLTRVASAKNLCRGVTEEEALHLLLKENMFPLYDRIFKDLGAEAEQMRIQEAMEESTRMVLDTVTGALESIFRMYFPFEIQTNQDPQVTRQRLENALFIFLREFNICPSLINKGTAYAIWNQVMKEQIVIPETTNNNNNNNTSNLNSTKSPEKAKDNNKKTKGKVNDMVKDVPFSFERFKMFLTRIANFGFQEEVTEAGVKCNQPERTIMLLERMDMAFKVLNPEKRATVSRGTVGGKLSLSVSKEALDKIYGYLKAQEIIKEEEQVDANGRPNVKVTSGTKYENYNINDADLIRLYEKHYFSLIKIFQYYCSFGEPLNTTRLHAFKFNKLLREAGLLYIAPGSYEQSFRILKGLPPSSGSVNILTAADADVIVASLTGPGQVREINDKKITHDTTVETHFIGFLNYLYKNNPLNLTVQGRLEYEAFLKAIEMVAHKLYPEEPIAKAVRCIIDKSLIKLEKEVNQIQKMIGSEPLKALVDVLQDMNMVQFLGDAHKALTVYYKYYSDAKGMMNIEKFMQFCKDFGIFPSLVTKGKLCNFFNALAGVRSQAEENDLLNQNNNNTNNNTNINILDQTASPKKKKPLRAPGQQENELLDQHMFIEAIALCALEIPYLNPQPSDMQKVCNLLEKINQSQGPTIIKMKLGVTRVVSGSSWDILNEIRVKYPELFMHSLEDEELEGIINGLNKESPKKR